MKPRGHHWVLIVVVIALAYHYRAQLLALWHVNVAPALASILPPAVASAIGAGPHPLDVPPGRRLSSDIVANSGVPGGLSLFEGPLARALRNALIGGDLQPSDQSYLSTPGGLGGGAIEEGNAQGGGNIGPVPNGFGNCSTNPRDGKLLCP